MKRFIFSLATIYFTCILSMNMQAQMPTMKIKVDNITLPSAVSISNMDIQVEIVGNIATTTMKLVFHNSSSRVLEGELTFPLPDGATVSEYAIDINGKLRFAVPVSKAKATEVFESIEHRQIDPGLIERVEGNNFRTRVYPLPANGNRTVLIAYEEILTFNEQQAFQYHLPLGFEHTIPSFSLLVKVYQSAKKPQLIEKPDGNFSFSENHKVYEARIQKKDYKPIKALTIQIPKDIHVPEIALQKNTDGSYYFLANAFAQKEAKSKIWSDRLGIIWDQSLSGLERNQEKELELLGKIIHQKQNLTIELGLLNIYFKKAKSFTIKNGDWSALKSYLQNLPFDGGTDFSQINDQTLAASEYLLFSDGLSTFGPNSVQVKKTVYSICSSTKADFSTLKEISAKTGGKFINLSNTSVSECFKQISENHLQYLGLEEQVDISEVYPALPVEMNGHISVAGITQKAPREITLLFGRNGKVEFKQKVKLQTEETDIRVNRIWAQMKISEMDIQYEKNKEDIEQLGKQFGLVTRNTSLLVLEDIADYVRYEIAPPAELLNEYNILIKNNQIEKEARVNDILERAIYKVEALKEWWNTVFTPGKPYPSPYEEAVIFENEIVEDEIETISKEDIQYSEQADMIESAHASGDIPPPPPLTTASQHELKIVTKDLNADFDDTYQSEARSGNTNSKSVGVTGSIKLPSIQSDKDYITQLATSKDPYTAYLSLRKTYMGTPSFFFDVSGFFYDLKENEKALLILSSLAELSIENAELYKTLGYRLKEKGEYKHELFITGKVKEWCPMDPQSHRDYALALQDNGRYQEALDCLYSILNASYSPEAANRDYGIEEIIVCEINNLIALHGKKLQLKNIHPALKANLPVDIRVVINWNKNDTDIDLWVTDPNGEQCYYSHKLTSAGGLLSDDFTQGYGPEQFLLKKAINGTYRIETNFFGEQQLTLSGPTTIMAEIYLYYSDGRQERKVITFQDNGSINSESGNVLIGEFTFSDKKNRSDISHPVDSFKNWKPTNFVHKILDSNSASPPYSWAVGLGCLGCLLIVFNKNNN